MEEKNEKCPLCGKPVKEGDSLCEDCRNYTDNQYATDLWEDMPAEESPLDNDDADLLEGDDLQEEDSAAEVVAVADDVVEEVPEEEPKVKKKISKTLAFIIIGCLCLIAAGAIGALSVSEKRTSVENEQAFWDSCVVINTPLSYAKYLVTYQNGMFVDEAHKRIRDLRLREDSAWVAVKNSKDINDFNNYLSENPNTPYVNAVRLKMDSLSWKKVSKDGTADAYLSYIENVKLGNIAGGFLDIAQSEYDYLSQIKSLEGAALDSVKTKIASLYLALSVYDKDVLTEMLAPKVIFYSDTLKSTDIVDHITKDIKTRTLKKINLQANKSSLSATRDGKGNVSIKLLVNKEEINKADKKQYSVDSTRIEINDKNQIISITKK